MKKTIFFAAVALTVTACNKSNEFHQTYVQDSYKVIFADQTLDSVQYVTTETHSLTSNASWCRVDNSYQTSINEYIKAHQGIYKLSVGLALEPNTTGALRTAAVTINAGEYSASSMIIQFCNLELARPQVVLSPDLSADSVSTLYLNGISDTDSIMFRTNFPWTLTVPENSPITLEQTNGQAGFHTIRFSYDQNPLSQARKMEIHLTSATGTEEDSNITTIIPLIQATKPTSNSD